MKKIKGKFLQLRIDGHTVALSTNCSLQTTTQYSSDDKTKDESMGPSSGTAEWVDWSMSVDALVGVSADQQLTHEQLLDYQLSLTELDAEFFLAANAKGDVPKGDWTPDQAKDMGVARYGGKATIESINTNAPGEGKASFSVNLKAAGILQKITE